MEGNPALRTEVFIIKSHGYLDKTLAQSSIPKLMYWNSYWELTFIAKMQEHKFLYMHLAVIHGTQKLGVTNILTKSSKGAKWGKKYLSCVSNMDNT